MFNTAIIRKIPGDLWWRLQCNETGRYLLVQDRKESYGSFLHRVAAWTEQGGQLEEVKAFVLDYPDTFLGWKRIKTDINERKEYALSYVSPRDSVIQLVKNEVKGVEDYMIFDKYGWMDPVFYQEEEARQFLFEHIRKASIRDWVE